MTHREDTQHEPYRSTSTGRGRTAATTHILYATGVYTRTMPTTTTPGDTMSNLHDKVHASMNEANAKIAEFKQETYIWTRPGMGDIRTSPRVQRCEVQLRDGGQCELKYGHTSDHALGVKVSWQTMFNKDDI